MDEIVKAEYKISKSKLLTIKVELYLQFMNCIHMIKYAE